MDYFGRMHSVACFQNLSYFYSIFNLYVDVDMFTLELRHFGECDKKSKMTY